MGSSCKLPPRREDIELRAYGVHVSKEDGGNSEQKHITRSRSISGKLERELEAHSFIVGSGTGPSLLISASNIL